MPTAATHLLTSSSAPPTAYSRHPMHPTLQPHPMHSTLQPRPMHSTLQPHPMHSTLQPHPMHPQRLWRAATGLGRLTLASYHPSHHLSQVGGALLLASAVLGMAHVVFGLRLLRAAEAMLLSLYGGW